MTSGQEKKYWAFISYSSKDRKWGQWLHRRLEGYQIPADLQGQTLFDGAVLGRNLRPVFRDRDELTGSPDLGSAIHDALQHSRFLVVLCSRNSARSEWVNKEIAEFRQLGKERNILALILDGEPNATSRGQPGDECFPLELRYPAEPIAGDLRRDGDGRERGFLKVLAGIAQLDFDRLYRRHERIRARRRIVQLVVSIALLSLFAGLAGLAESRRMETAATLAAIFDNKGRAALDDKRFADAAIYFDKSMKLSDTPRAHIGALESIRNLPGEITAFAIGQAVDCSVMNQDRTMLALARHGSNNIELWDPAGKKNKAVLSGHGSSVFALAFSHDGSLLASCSIDCSVKIWKLSDASMAMSVDVGSYPLSLAFMPGDKVVVIGHSDGSLKAWNIGTQEPPRILVSGMNAVHALALSPDGRRAYAGAGNKVVVWDLEKMKPENVFDGHADEVLFVTLSPDGKSVLSGSRDRTMKLWELGQGRLFYTYEGHGSGVSAGAFSSDGKLIASASFDGTIKIWDTDKNGLDRMWMGYCAKTLTGHQGPVRSIGFLPDNRTVISGSGDGSLKVWDSAFSHAGLDRMLGSEETIALLALSMDGTLALMNTRENIVELKGRDGKKILDLAGHEAEIQSAAFSPDKRYAVTGAYDGAVRIWDLADGHCVHELPGLGTSIEAVAVSGDGTCVVAGAYDGTVMVWDLKTGSQMGRFVGHAGPVKSVALSADHRFAASGSSDRSVHLWSLDGGGASRVLGKLEGEISALAFSPDCHNLAGGSDNAEISIWDLEVMGDPRILRGHSQTVSGLGYSPDGKYLASGSWDDTVRLWATATGTQVWVFRGQDYIIKTISFAPDGNSIISGNSDGHLMVWDTGFALSRSKVMEVLATVLGSGISYGLDENDVRIPRNP